MHNSLVHKLVTFFCCVIYIYYMHERYTKCTTCKRKDENKTFLPSVLFQFLIFFFVTNLSFLHRYDAFICTNFLRMYLSCKKGI